MVSRLFVLLSSLLSKLPRTSWSAAAARVLRRTGASAGASPFSPSRGSLLRALPFGALALVPAAHAGGITVPAGFNVESSPASAGNLTAVLADGTVLVDTGSFGNDQLSVRHADGSLTLWATGFGSLAGLAQSPVTGDIVVGDSFSAPALHVLRDLNHDGDVLDAGENVPHPVALPILSNGAAPLPFALSYRPGTDELYVTGSTPFSVQPTLGVVVRIAGGSAGVYADGLGFAAGQVWTGGSLYVADVDSGTFVGRVITLTDGNADGDALDAGEVATFASGLSGASDLVRAQDGTFYLSGLLDFSDFSGSVGRLLPDGNADGVSDGVDETYFDGFGFSGALTLLEGSAGFVPGSSGDGMLVVQDFSTATVDRTVRSAPLATLAVSGTIANNASFTLTAGGERGALPFVLLSTDRVGPTLAGIGDLAAGFNAPFLLLPLPAIGASGDASLTLLLHHVEGAVGVPFTAQAFTLQAGDVGISNALHLAIAR